MYTRLSHALTACVAAATLLILPVSGVAQTQANATAVQAAASTATATGIAPEATAAPKAHEAATNPYGLEALWGGSDLVAKTQTFALLYAGAGLAGASSHSGRRTFLTSLANKGTAIHILKTLAGHRNIATTAAYLYSSPAQLRAAVELV